MPRVNEALDAASLVLLSENKLMVGLGDAAIAECAAHFKLIHSRRRGQLYSQGDPCNQIFCLLQGSVRCTRLAEDGSEFTTRIVGRGDLFGEEALFGDVAFSSTATHLYEGIVAVCPAANMLELSARYPILSANVAHSVRENQNRTLDRLEQLLHKPVRARLLDLLQDFAARSAAGNAGDKTYEVTLTHVEIALLIGSTRETVSCELGKLVSAGLVAKHGRKILIGLSSEAA